MLRLNQQTIPNVASSKSIQIQPMLRLNEGKQWTDGDIAKNSNTTNVKVKRRYQVVKGSRASNSNTTNVKVKQ